MSSHSRIVIPLIALAAPSAFAAPSVVNPSFEQDRYTKGAGMAALNGGIKGWEFTGNAGINPVTPSGKTTSPFHGNGRIPHGTQFAFIQHGGSLRQTVAGFQAGKCYRVVYRENGRVAGAGIPSLEVLVGGVTVVSSHEVPPVEDPRSFETEFYLVKSAVFSPSGDGALPIEFRKPLKERTTAYIVMCPSWKFPTYPTSG